MLRGCDAGGASHSIATAEHRAHVHEVDPRAIADPNPAKHGRALVHPILEPPTFVASAPGWKGDESKVDRLCPGMSK